MAPAIPASRKAMPSITLARLVALVNAYDNLCNPVNVAQAMTPHEALSYMFAQQRQRFDPRFLQAFIRFMGFIHQVRLSRFPMKRWG